MSVGRSRSAFPASPRRIEGKLSQLRLLIDNTLATETVSIPITSGWLPTSGFTVELAPRLGADAVSSDDVALVPSSELLHLRQSHVVHPEIAVVADASAAVAMRVPVRPDAVESTPIRLLNTSGTAELLARATVPPFYGIDPTGWIRDDDASEAARAEVIVVEGAEALREPEAGFSEDLGRAWFILTAQPFVSHVLLVPRELSAADRVRVIQFLGAARDEGLARRRQWRPALADRDGISRDRANAFWAAQRLAFGDGDRQALLELFQRGTAGTSNAGQLDVEFIEGTALA